MPKLLCNFIDIALRHGSSPANLLHTFRTPFPKNTCGRLLLHLDETEHTLFRIIRIITIIFIH